MVKVVFNCFKYLFIVLLLFVSTNSMVYAATGLTTEEKAVFNLAGNFGETSFTLSDLLANKDIMGVVVLQQKVERMIKGIAVEPALADELKLSKKNKELMDKFIKEVDDSYKEEVLDKEKLMKAKETFALLTKSVEEEISKQYGAKYVWLFNTGFLTYFTKASMQSEYKEKLILLDFGYLLDYVPYDLPTSVVASLSDIVTANNANITQLQADLLKEASENIAYYFNDPLTYTPPATLKDFVGKWEGRLSSPNGTDHKASLLVRPDLTGILNVKGMFKNMPVSSISVTQSLISFNIKPYGEDKLVIKFSGRIVDDVISGEAVDVSGKTGLWQFLKVSKPDLSDIASSDFKNDPTYLDKLIGVWKGKVLEENGAISNLTLRFNLIDDSVMTVVSKDKEQSLKLNSVAVNDKAVKFDVSSASNEGMDITFVGKFKGRVLEGNANASDGSRGYWKLVKVSDEVENENLNFDYNLDDLCDPVIEVVNEAYDVILASNNSIVIPSGKVREGKYKGFLEFSDGTRADLIFVLTDKKIKMILISKEDKSKLELNVRNMKITDREITFNALTGSDQSTEVKFKGKIFGNYIYGKAMNAVGEELTWELVAVDRTDKLLSGVHASDSSRIKGYWKGNIDFDGVFEEPVSINIDGCENKMIIGDNKSLNLSQIILDGSSVSFVIAEKPNLTFNGSLEDETITGKITSTEGLGVNVKLSRTQACVENPLTGIWKGSISSGKASADIVFDFAEDVKKVFIDDAKAASGRLELTVSKLSLNSNKLQFKANVPKNPVPIDFSGDLSKESIKGMAQNQVDGSKKLTWAVSKLKLEKYVPEDNITSKDEPPAPKYQKTFSFLDEIAEKKNKVIESSVNEENKDTQKVEAIEQANDKTSQKKKDLESDKSKISKTEKADKKASADVDKKSKAKDKKSKKKKVKSSDKKKKKKEVKEDTETKKSKIAKEDKKAKKKDSKKKAKSKKEKEPEVSDSEMFKAGEINKAKKQMKQVKQQKEDKKKAKKEKKASKEAKKKKKDTKEEEKATDKKKDKEIVKEDKQEEKKKDTEQAEQNKKDDHQKIATATEKKVDKPEVTEVKETEQMIPPEEFIGKWVGELADPNKDKGEIILDIKSKESYIYVDKEGEKIPFKLFDFHISDKNISFKIKPSPDADYGIMFKGALIQGILSGDAIDPSGKKGKWHAKSVKSVEEKTEDDKNTEQEKM